MEQPVAMIQPARRSSLKKLSRIWQEGRTGQIRDGKSVIEIVNGEPLEPSDLNGLVRVLREDRLRFRERDVDGNPPRRLGAFLFHEALDCVAPSAMNDVSRLDRVEGSGQPSDLPLGPDTVRFLDEDRALGELTLLEPSRRSRVKHELAAMVLLGLFKAHSETQEAQERSWLKSEFRRLSQLSAEDPRAVVGVGPQASMDQVTWLARKKVQRCVQLQQTSPSPRVRKVALEVGAAIMAAARSIA